VGAEAIGSDSPALDAEIIQLVVDALGELGFSGLDVRVNSVGTEASRVRYRGVLLEAIEAAGGELAPEALARYRHNPLRIFDAKEYGATLKQRLPLLSDYLVGEDRAHFARVKDLLASLSVPFTEDAHLVRGLDYYTRTVFEVYHGAHGAQSALCGGGRYDTLVAECGGPDTPAIGMSAGLERIVEALPAASSAHDVQAPYYYVVCLGADAEARALQAARVLREFGSVELDVSGRSQKTLLEAASKRKARVAIVVDASGPEVAYHDLSARSDVRVAFDALREHARRSKPSK
jgi:histidyl-tRNA synthetase